jgi:hypothetical protein
VARQVIDFCYDMLLGYVVVTVAEPALLTRDDNSRLIR